MIMIGSGVSRVAPDYTELLLHFDGVDGATTFVDSSAHGRTVIGINQGSSDYPLTLSHYPSLVSSSFFGSKFGGTLASFALKDALLVQGIPALQDFTFEFWGYEFDPAGSSNFLSALSLYPVGGPYIIGTNEIGVINCGTDGYYLTAFNQQPLADGYPISLAPGYPYSVGYTIQSPWNAFAFVREGAIGRVFIGGYKLWEDTVSTTTLAGDLVLFGNCSSNPYDPHTAVIGECRLSSKALYSANYTPATSAFTS